MTSLSFLLHWLYTHFGIAGSGPYYGFWSGAGSDISEIMIFGAVIAGYRKINCEVHGCPRIGRHATAAGHHVCRKHHPDEHLTTESVREAHRNAG